MARISEETIQQVAAANDIAEVIGGYLPLKKAGGAFRALCPFHREKTPSFNVNPQRQIFHCFGCGAGGSVFRFVMMYENIEFVAAVRKLASRAGITIVEDAGGPDPGADIRTRLIKVHSDAASWFHEVLMKDEQARHARDYLKSRGINQETAVNWQLGYAPDSMSSMLEWGRKSGYAPALLQEAGLLMVRDQDRGGGFYDRFRDRLMFPICNDSESPIAFSGRTLKSDPKVPKYLNSPETPIFRKGRILFGLAKSKRAVIDDDLAIVLEGQLDLITCFEAGIRNVVAPQGTAFTIDQARVIKRYASGVVLCFDSDTAGQNAAEKSFPALLEANLAVKVAQLPAGQDPDSLVRSQGPEAFRELISGAEDYFGFLIRKFTKGADIRDSRTKLGIADRLAGTISLVSDPVLRDDAVTRASAALEISASELRKKLKAPGLKSTNDVELEVMPSRIRPSEPVHILCLLALHSAEAREWLRGQPWREVLADAPDGAPLEAIMTNLIETSDAAVSAFVAARDKSLEAYFAGLLSQRPPEKCDEVIQEWWRRFALQMRLKSKLRNVELLARAAPPDWAQIAAAQKEVLDLQLLLKELDPL
jgi:DNA primase